jgi:hypothetical protein
MIRRQFDEATERLITAAELAKKSKGGKLTKGQKLLLVMKDGGWHTGQELAYRVSWRFGGYLHTLKQHGVEWEKARDSRAPKGEVWWKYRLCKVSDIGAQKPTEGSDD